MPANPYSSIAATYRTASEMPKHAGLLNWSGIALVGVSWFSAAVFGLYIAAFYLMALPTHQLGNWNANLPGLYDQNYPVSVAAMALHLAAGGVILLLGPIQLIDTLRRRWPAFHHWAGRIYVTTSAAAGAGGLAFILGKGTVGGTVMNVGFGIYGALMVLAAFQTYRHAVKREFALHRAWGIRLFALAIGSWLYRMDYGLWLTFTHQLGHTSDFRGPFDILMAFFFYVPNLILADLFLRARQSGSRSLKRAAIIVLLNLGTAVSVVGSYYFIRFYWGPAIVQAITGRT